ncbi:hypothetical protein D3C84_807400 [compost metagenome]
MQRRLAGDFVDYLAKAGDRDDFTVEPPGLLRRRGAHLRLQGVGILGLAADPVAPGDQFSGLQHGHVGVQRVAFHPRIALLKGPRHVAILYGADVFLAGTDRSRHAVDHDLLGGGGDGHQARGALAVQGLPAD